MKIKQLEVVALEIEPEETSLGINSIHHKVTALILGSSHLVPGQHAFGEYFESRSFQKLLVIQDYNSLQSCVKFGSRMLLKSRHSRVINP